MAQTPWIVHTDFFLVSSILLLIPCQKTLIFKQSNYLYGPVIKKNLYKLPFQTGTQIQNKQFETPLVISNINLFFGMFRYI